MRHPSLRRCSARAIDAAAGRLFGLPPATADYTVRRAIRVPMRDGVSLAADLYQPVGPAAGTLLVRGPYGRTLAQTIPLARVFASRGYHVLFVSSRGTFGSGGRFDPMMTELDDGRDVVRWLVAQPWFTGRFATLGPSYLGYTQWALLVDPPPEMAAAVVAVGPHDFSRHVWGSGAFRLDFLGWSYGIVHQEDHHPLIGAVTMLGRRKKVRPAMDGIPLASAAVALLGGRAPWYGEWVTRPDLDDPFWVPTQHGAALERADIPVLVLGGWKDIFLDQTVEQYERLHRRGVDVAMTVGPWAHLDSAGRALPVMTRETFDWLEQHLAGRRGRRSRPVRVFVTGAGEWREMEAWPPDTVEQVLHLHPGGTLGAAAPAEEASASFTFDPSDPTPTVGGPLLGTGGGAEDGPLLSRGDVLVLTTPPLRRGLEMMGRAVLELTHRRDNPHADVFARISDVDPGGRSRNVTETYLRLDRLAGATVTLTMRDAAHRFAAGNRLRLVIAGGSHPQYSRNLGTGENPGTGTVMRPCTHTVTMGPGAPSRLVIPVTGAAPGPGDAGRRGGG